MFKVWIVSFLLLLGLVECYQWVKHFHLPLPALILGGALLAIASNSQHLIPLPWQRSPVTSAQDSRQAQDKPI